MDSSKERWETSFLIIIQQGQKLCKKHKRLWFFY